MVNQYSLDFKLKIVKMILNENISKHQIERTYSVVLQNVGSVSEFAKHQDSFFNKDSKDEKFQTRIEYLEDNIDIILSDAKVDFASSYVFKHYMITNKVFISEFKDISFDIITYSELMNLIDNTYR